MSENTIEVLAVSLAEAREQLQAPIPVGRLVLAEQAARGAAMALWEVGT